MLQRLRIAILLYALLFVAAAQYFATARSTDWDEPLWVTVFPVNGDGAASTGEHIARLESDAFADLETFFAAEAKRHGLALERPFRFQLAAPSDVAPPRVPADPSVLDALLFSLRLRWRAVLAEWRSALPSSDITLFAVYHAGESSEALERSAGLAKGLVAVANVFAAPKAEGSNLVVIAHELLHTLGASDKYDPATNLPRFPDGYADPHAQPALPQKRAELMAGRRPLGLREAEIPRSLREVVIGASTAREIGWLAQD